MAVVGSVHMFSDQYVDKEENAKVQVGDETSYPYRIPRSLKYSKLFGVRPGDWVSRQYCSFQTFGYG